MSRIRSARIADLYRYPVKGLSPEPLPSVSVQPGQTFPVDRRYAIENGPSGFDPAAPAWHEFELVGKTLAAGDARLKVVKRITRCAAINVDPDTAARDLAIPQALQRRFGHGDCGVYAEVIAGGTISIGDAIATEQPPLLM